ncbi:MAG TPA: PaaI family thioesterase [Acidimicrobiales bacterium]|nr:PaaI family thioesterase [Acidimicrobiales bacterium]
MGERRNMDRWLGDGGMGIIGDLGGDFIAYGVDGEDLGWAEGTFTPTALACNPHGTVQAGVHAVLLDAAMNFAINAALAGRDRTNSTIEIATELMRPAARGETYVVRGEVVRLARQIAFAEATVTNAQREMVSRATGTFLVHREAATES